MKTHHLAGCLIFVALAASGCAAWSPEEASRSMKAHPAGPPASALRGTTLTLAWNGETFDVPPPAAITPEMRATKQYADWWRVGDVRKMEWTDAQGGRCVAETIGRARREDGRVYPIIPFVWRYRPDGTLDVKTMNHPGGEPGDWAVFAGDGKTKLLEVTRGAHDGGPPYVEHVTFFDAAGVKVRQYRANRDGVAYIEWFFKPNGQIERWNGGTELDKPRPEGGLTAAQ